MDKDLKKLIDESIDNFFHCTHDICGHCKKEIRENREYTEDGGKTWRHLDCKGLIREELPLGGEEKYLKQQPGGEMMAVNTTSLATEAVEQSEEVQNVGPAGGTGKFFDGECRFLNGINTPLKVTCHKFLSKVQEVQQAAYSITVEPQ
jgi:hypothetical protein